MSTNISSQGVKRRLDREQSPDENFTEEDVADRSKVARKFIEMLRDIASLKRRWWPERIDFEDRDIADSSGTVLYRFAHGLDGRVRWWPVDWVSPGGAGPQLVRDEDASDDNTLVLRSYLGGTLTLRVEEAG